MEAGGQIMEDAYEAVGLRDTGDVYTVEILGRQTLTDAVDLAQRWADRWQAAVNLYLVPYVSLGSAPWRDDQMQLVQQFVPTRYVSRRGAHPAPASRGAQAPGCREGKHP
jgi:hypothetical protein